MNIYTCDQDQYFEELAKLYPELMERAEAPFIYHGSGWNGLLDAFCACVYSDLQYAKNCFKAAVEHPRDDGGKYLAETEAAIATALSKLPVITVIKETFGKLQIRTAFPATAEVNAYKLLAAAMSAHVCEVCGKPGSIEHTSDADGSFIKTLCKSCL